MWRDGVVSITAQEPSLFGYNFSEAPPFGSTRLRYNYERPRQLDFSLKFPARRSLKP
jgi:hypothetical protein